MTQLEDTRPHVFRELSIDPDAYDHEDAYAALIGRLVGELLDTWPDVDLPTIRLWRHSADGVPTVRVDARRGQLAAPTVECPQCHQPAGRPHTDYCTLEPGKVWDGVLPSGLKLHSFAKTTAPRDMLEGECGGSLLEWVDPNTCPHTVTEYDDRGRGTCRRCGTPR